VRFSACSCRDIARVVTFDGVHHMAIGSIERIAVDQHEPLLLPAHEMPHERPVIKYHRRQVVGR
jgi:hypothetical protein